MQAVHSPWLAEFSASYRDLLRFLRRRTGSDDTARELAHDAWLRIAAAAPATPAPRDSDHARAYLFTVAERLAIDHLRRQHHGQQAVLPSAALTLAEHAPDVAETHAYTAALRAVDRALATMPERTREIFVAHRLDGIAHDELAQRHGVSRKTIEREVTRAMDLAEAALAGPGSRTGQHGQRGQAQRQGRRRTLAALLGIAGLGTAAELAWQAWRSTVPAWQAAFATLPGQLRTVELAERSQLTLDADSAAEVRLFAARRELRLTRGGAFFAVTPDAERPFVVLAGPLRVTVLGTRFAVEHVDGGVQVAVESGLVRVELADEAGEAGSRPAGMPVLVLGAGESTRSDASGQLQPAAPRALPDIAPWRHGWLHFERQPLASVVQALNRYRAGAPIRLDPAVAALPVVARVDLARSATWLQGLPAVLPVRVQRQADGGWWIGPR